MLKIDIIKFEAQDVVTASVACICDPSCGPCNGGDGDHGGFVNNDWKKCPATTHKK